MYHDHRLRSSFDACLCSDTPLFRRFPAVIPWVANLWTDGLRLYGVKSNRSSVSFDLFCGTRKSTNYRALLFDNGPDYIRFFVLICQIVEFSFRVRQFLLTPVNTRLS